MPNKICISYAHKDEAYKTELIVQLKMLQREGHIEAWHDRRIAPGQPWDEAIKSALDDASIIIFLVSPDFLASDYIYDVEIKKAFERYKAGQCKIVPIIVRPCHFQDTEIRELQALPKHAKPISTWSNKDIAWYNVLEELKKIISPDFHEQNTVNTTWKKSTPFLFKANELEKLEKKLELLMEAYHPIREKYNRQTDPTEERIYEMIKREAQIGELKLKIAKKYNIDSAEGQTILRQKLETFSIEEEMGPIHLVNCGRRTMMKHFWDAFYGCPNNAAQFYFIGACQTQMPPDFAERIVYEIIGELDKGMDAIYCKYKPNDNRVKILEFPFYSKGTNRARNLKESQQKFKIFFSKHFDFNRIFDFDTFLQTGSGRLKYKYAIFIFEIHEVEWEPFFEDYFRWIMNTFKNIHKDAPQFLFFFVVYLKNLHKDDFNSEQQKEIKQSMIRLDKDFNMTTALFPLYPVPTDHLQTWVMKLGERNPSKIDEIITVLGKGLSKSDLIQNFKKNKLLNMDIISRFQKLVYNIFDKK